MNSIQSNQKMNIIPMKLPPLPGKTITLSRKPTTVTVPKSAHTRKYSVQQLETTDESDETHSPAPPTPHRQLKSSKKLTESSRMIRIRDNSMPSKKIKKLKSMEDQQFSDLPPHVTTKSWVLYEMKQGRILYGKRGKKQRQMASLTKIMNLITILELLEKLDLNPRNIRVKATKIASSIQGTTAELSYQSEYCLEDLFYGMMLPSGNDAAFLVGEVGGYLAQKKSLSLDVDEFSKILEKKQGGFVTSYLRDMNQLACKIGLNSSTFTNTHGLNNILNISCAEDLARLCTYAMKNHKFRKIVRTRHYNYHFTRIEFKEKENEDGQMEQEVISFKDKGSWQNTNKMLGEGWSGIKTGITPNAGPCLAASVLKTFSGKQYQFLVILLDSESMQARWQQVQKLVDWAILTRQYL